MSISIALIMLLNMLVPVFSFAATSMWFDYRNGKISGGIYTADPDSVTVQAKDAVGEYHQFTSGVVGSYFQYDDDNKTYYYLHFSETMDFEPVDIKFTEGSDSELVLTKDEYGYYQGVDDSSVSLDVYRMTGTHEFINKLGGSYLSKGDTILSFTPETTLTPDMIGHQYISIKLPYQYLTGIYSKYEPSNTSASDFQLVTETGSVSAEELLPLHNFYDDPNSEFNRFALKFPEPIQKGVTYKLVLSPSSEGNEIKLASAGSGYLAEVRYGEYLTHTTADETFYYFSAQNVSKFHNITLKNNDPIPGPNLDPIAPPPIVPTPPVVEIGTQPINAEEFDNAQNGKISVQLEDGTKKLQLPANTSSLLGDNELVVYGDGFAITLSASELETLLYELSEEQLKDANIEITIESASTFEKNRQIKSAVLPANTKVSTAGSAVHFNFNIKTSDDQTLSLHDLNTPLRLALEVSENANTDLVGVYLLNEDGELEYLGSDLNENGELVVDVSKTGKLLVLAYDKTFEDVKKELWAHDMIKKVSALHLFQGDENGNFNPSGNLSRAEFSAVLSRLLKLETKSIDSPASFEDVQTNDWYSGYVQAVKNAGLLNGDAEGNFNPNQDITREQMAVVLGRLLELGGFKNSEREQALAFSDNEQISEWAAHYIQLAVQAGLINGKDNGKFDPNALLTRAEAAKIFALLHKL